VSNYPTLDPVVVKSGSFFIDRLLERNASIEVGVGDRVSPGDIVARTGDVEKSFTIYLANELGVPNDSLKKYLAKAIGSTVSEGEPIARVRRGLRTAAVRSPASGVLVHVDDSEGTITLTASSGPVELTAFVTGVVEQVHAERGVTIRTEGSRVYGIVGFGNEAVGPLVVGSDRNDRELTADQVSSDWRGAIVLAGMTVGVPALSKLRDAGVAGVVVGSIAEGDIRRFISPHSASSASAFWSNGGYATATGGDGMVVVVTEGFGRLQMADPVYDFLATMAGSNVSVTAHTEVGTRLARPELYFANGQDVNGSASASPEPGRPVRVADTHRLGVAAVIQSEPATQAFSSGLQRQYVEVQFEGGDVEKVPLENVEVLV
jgi:hypothetical protein